MPLVTSQGYQLQPDVLGSIQQGQQAVQNQQMLGANRLAAQQAQTQIQNQQLGRQLAGGILNSPQQNPEDQSQQLTQLLIADPDMYRNVMEKIGINKKEDALLWGKIGEALNGSSPEQMPQKLNAVLSWMQQSGQPKDFQDRISQLAQQSPENQQMAVQMMRAFGNATERLTSKQQEFNQLQSLPQGKIRDEAAMMFGAVPKTLSPEQVAAIQQAKGDVKVEQDIATEEGKSKVQLEYKPKIAAAVKLAEEEAKAKGETFNQLKKAEASLPGLEEAIGNLKELAPLVTSTIGGKIFDAAVKEAGFGSTEGANARAKWIAIINNQVLPLLKPTFGAAFTEREGEALRATMGDPDASPSQKMEQLNAFIDQKKRDVVGLQNELDNGGTVEEWKAKRFNEQPQQPTMTATGPNGEKIGLINGQWVKL